MSQVFLFTGEESFLLKKQVRVWKDEFIKKYGDMNISHLDAQTQSLKDIISECLTLPFLATKRLIFIDNFPPSSSEKGSKSTKNKEIIEEFHELIENPPESSVIAFIQLNPDKRTSLFKRLQKHGQIKSFEPLQGRKLQEWVFQVIREKNGKILPSAANYLIQLAGNNLWNLFQEIQKLVSFVGEKPISERDIDLLVSPHPEANIFSFTDAISQKNIKKAIHLLERLIQSGETVNHIFYMIIRQFRILIQLKSLHDRGLSVDKIIQMSKMNPFVVKTAIKQVHYFEVNELKQAYALLLDIDFKLKSGKIKQLAGDQRPFLQEIERFIFFLCYKKK